MLVDWLLVFFLCFFGFLMHFYSDELRVKRDLPLNMGGLKPFRWQGHIHGDINMLVLARRFMLVWNKVYSPNIDIKSSFDIN